MKTCRDIIKLKRDSIARHIKRLDVAQHLGLSLMKQGKYLLAQHLCKHIGKGILPLPSLEQNNIEFLLKLNKKWITSTNLATNWA